MPHVHVRRRTVKAAFPDDGDVATFYRGLAAMLAVGGAISLSQAHRDRLLTRSEARRAHLLGAAGLALGLAGAATARSGAQLARALRSCPPLTVLAGFAPLVAAPWTGGSRTPLHFTTCVGVGLAGVVLESDRALQLAGVTGTAWVAQAAAVQRRRPGREEPSATWTYVVMPLSYLGGAVIGAAGGRSALRARSLQQSLRRAERYVGELGDMRRAFEASSGPLHAAIDGFAEVAAGVDAGLEPLVRAAAQRSRDRLDDVRVVLTAAGRADDDQSSSLDTQLAEELRLGPAHPPVVLTGSTGGAVLASTARLVAHLVVVRALANARAQPSTTGVKVCLGHAAGEVRLIVASDAVPTGAPGAPVRAGRGTRDSTVRLQAIGGSLAQAHTPTGFRVEAHLPTVSTAPIARASVAEELIRVLEEALWSVVRIDAAMVMSLAWGSAEYVGSHRRRSACLATATVTLAETLWHLDRFPLAWRLERLMLLTAAVAATGAHGRQAPLAGWGGMVLATYALERPSPRVLGFAALLATATARSYRGPRLERTMVVLREGVGMVLPGVIAWPVRRLFSPVLRREPQLDAVLERLEQLQDVAEEVAYRTHGFAEPVQHLIPLVGHHPATTALREAIAEARDAGTALGRALEDRRALVDELVEELSYRVWPAHVELHDAVKPLGYPSTEGRVRQASRRRRALSAMGLLADHVLADVRPDVLGRWPLVAVELYVREDGEDALLATAVPRPPLARPGSDTGALALGLAELEAAVADYGAGGAITVRIPLTG